MTDTDHHPSLVKENSPAPCAHNNWDNVRSHKLVNLLRCRTCRAKWRLRLPQDVKCKDFWMDGRCEAGDACAKLHVHRRKEPVESRMQRFGQDMAPEDGSEKDRRVGLLVMLRHPSSPGSSSVAEVVISKRLDELVTVQLRENGLKAPMVASLKSKIEQFLREVEDVLTDESDDDLYNSMPPDMVNEGGGGGGDDALAAGTVGADAGAAGAVLLPGTAGHAAAVQASAAAAVQAQAQAQAQVQASAAAAAGRAFRMLPIMQASQLPVAYQPAYVPLCMVQNPQAAALQHGLPQQGYQILY